MGQLGNHRPLEALIKIQRPLVVLAMVGEDGQRQLRRPAAAVSPFKSRRAVVPQVEPGVSSTAHVLFADGEVNFQ